MFSELDALCMSTGALQKLELFLLAKNLRPPQKIAGSAHKVFLIGRRSGTREENILPQ